MTAKTSERMRKAFLRAFAETGNQALAAEQAGISRSTVRNLRRFDSGFDARWRAAKAESARRLPESGRNRPPAAWKRRAGIELVVQRPGKRPAQVVRSRGARWTARAEARFLGALRTCNNARLACQLTGMTLSSYEAHWRRWPDFRRRVEKARAFAGLRLDAALAAERQRPYEPPDWIDDLPDFAPDLTIADRINLARRAKAEATRARRRAARDPAGRG